MWWRERWYVWVWCVAVVAYPLSLFAQHHTTPTNPANPFNWITALKNGGPWAIVVGLTIACVYLWRDTKSVRSDNDARWEKHGQSIIGLVEKSTENSVMLINTLGNNTKALENLDRRIENLERKRTDSSGS